MLIYSFSSWEKGWQLRKIGKKCGGWGESHSNYQEMIYMVKQSYNNQKGIPEYTLSSTRGTAQKKVGFSSPRSSINNLTSCSHSENDGQGHIQIQKNSNF